MQSSAVKLTIVTISYSDGYGNKFEVKLAQREGADISIRNVEYEEILDSKIVQTSSTDTTGDENYESVEAATDKGNS